MGNQVAIFIEEAAHSSVVAVDKIDRLRNDITQKLQNNEQDCNQKCQAIKQCFSAFWISLAGDEIACYLQDDTLS